MSASLQVLIYDHFRGTKHSKKNPNSNPIGKQFQNEDIIMVAGMK